MRALTVDQVASVLGCAVPATLATLDGDGFPYLTPIWFSHEDRVLRMTSLAHRPHVTNLRRDPRAALLVDGDNPLAGDFHGVDAVVGLMRALGEHSAHTLELDTRSVFGDDEHVIAVHVATAHRDDLEYRAHEIDVFHLTGGRISELWSFSEDQAATDALWR